MYQSLVPPANPKQKLLNRIANADIGSVIDAGNGVSVYKTGHNTLHILGRAITQEQFADLISANNGIVPQA